VLGLELLKVRHVLSVLARLLVVGQVAQVLILDGLCLRLKRLLLGRSQVLPVFANKLGNFGKAQVAPLELLAHFFVHMVSGRLARAAERLLTVGEEHVGRGRSLGRIVVRLATASASDHCQATLTLMELETNLGVAPVLSFCDHDTDRLSAVNGRGLDLDCILKLQLLGG
jgi:hypothetical protein